MFGREIRLDPVQLAPLLLAAVAYARRARTLRRRGRPVSTARAAAFAGGIALLAAALVTPIDRLGETRLFWVHMVQHLLLGDLAPLLIVLGVTGPLLGPLLARMPARRTRLLGHPVVALVTWVALLYAWHLPGLYEAALAHPLVHALEHASFFWGGVLMWAAVIEPLPGPLWFGTGWRALYVLVVRTAGAVLASVFVWAGTPLYPRYAHGERLAHVAPLTDQRIGGAIMFTEGGIVTLVLFAWLFLRWTRDAERRQALLDAGHDSRIARRAGRYGKAALPR